MCVFALTNAYAEHLIGTLRPECLAHIIILNEFSLKPKTYLQTTKALICHWRKTRRSSELFNSQSWVE